MFILSYHAVAFDTILGTLRSDDGDSNENATKQ